MPPIKFYSLLKNNTKLKYEAINSGLISEKDYDRIIVIPLVDQSVTPPRQFQIAAGIKDVDDKFEVYTNPAFDYAAEQSYKETKDKGIKIITWMSNWKERSYIFIPEALCSSYVTK